MGNIRLGQLILDNFSGGYSCEQAILSSKLVSFVGDSQNIDIYSTESNNGYGFAKMSGNTLYKSIEGEKIIGLHSYKHKDGKHRLIAHTSAENEAKLYYFNEQGEAILLKDGLDNKATESTFINFNSTLPEIRYLGILSTNSSSDPYIKIEIGVDPEIEEINAIDEDERKIKGLCLVSFLGKVWTNSGDRLHWSKSLDPFDWARADDAGYKQLDSNVIAIHTYADSLIILTENTIYQCKKDLTSNGFTFMPLAQNSAVSAQGIVAHDNFVLYFADDGIYPVSVAQEGTKKVDENIAWIINPKISNRDKGKNSEIFAKSITVHGRNEVWFHIPINEKTSCLLIHRFKQGRQSHSYWLPPRIQPKINCMCIFDNKIFTGNDKGEILQELKGETYNGQEILAIAELPEMDFNGTHNKQKFNIFCYVMAMKNCKFYVDYFFDGDFNFERQYIECGDRDEMFLWDDDSWDAEDGLWAWDELLEYKLDKPGKHNRLKLRFVAGENMNFNINKLSTTIRKVKNK